MFLAASFPMVKMQKQPQYLPYLSTDEWIKKNIHMMDYYRVLPLKRRKYHNV